MHTKLRTKILIHAKHTLFDELLSMVNESFEIIENPHQALVMMKMRDTSKQSLFYSGEVLVSQAKVKYHNHFGLGICMGMDFEKALKLAKIDAIFKSNHDILPQWINILNVEKQRQDTIATEDIDRILNTQVQFQDMDKPYDI